MKRCFLLLAVLLGVSGLHGQPEPQGSSSEILQKLLQLKSVGSVLYVAAHPDDENTRLLAFLAREKKVRTAYLSLTRGDGGQNLIGKEQGEMLGALRTQELLAARKIDGAEQFFTRAIDFGYSKNADETFRIWNKDSILYDVVLAIRKFKPDVIICRFPTTGEGGHGHHTASAILATEAFDAAADPSRFPSQLKEYKIWRTRRILWNTFNFGGNNTTAPDQIKTDVGIYNSLLGRSYGEIASESRSMHKSQGFGTSRQRGSNIEYFKFLKGDSARADLLEGINITWSRMDEAGHLAEEIDSCIRSYDATDPARSIQRLIALHKKLSAVNASSDLTTHYLKLKKAEIESLIADCAGLWMEAVTTEGTSVPGARISYSLQAVNRSSAKVRLLAIKAMNSPDSIVNAELAANRFMNLARHTTCPDLYSSPFWLEYDHPEGRYRIKEDKNINKPQQDPPVKFTFELEIEGYPLSYERYLVHKTSDPVKGEIYQPLQILPALTFSLSHRVLLFNEDESQKFILTLKANRAIKGKLDAKATKGYTVKFQESEFDLRAGGEKTVSVSVSAAGSTKEGKIELSAVENSARFRHIAETVRHDHIPEIVVLKNCEVRMARIDLKKTNSNLGYIPGAGDEVAASLERIGYTVTILKAEELSHQDLSRFSAIITGVRAFNVNQDLYHYMDKLNDYVEKGGNLIVQYNTNSRVGPLQSRIGPYPFTITRDRVTDEQSAITFKNEQHSFFKFPNVLTKEDFKGWVQERGIYFASEFDKNFVPLLLMNDPGEKPHDGSLIIASHGKGNIVYTGLSFFRQLPAGVPGAYRAFVNLLSLPQNQ